MQHILSDEEYHQMLENARKAKWADRQVQAIREAMQEKYGKDRMDGGCPASKQYCDGCLLQDTTLTPDEFMASSPRCLLGYHKDFSK